MNEKDELPVSFLNLIPENIVPASGELDSYHKSETLNDSGRVRSNLDVNEEMEYSQSLDIKNSLKTDTMSDIYDGMEQENGADKIYPSNETSISLIYKRSGHPQIVPSVMHPYSNDQCLTEQNSNHHIIKSSSEISEYQSMSPKSKTSGHCRIEISNSCENSFTNRQFDHNIAESLDKVSELSAKSPIKRSDFSRIGTSDFHYKSEHLTCERSDNHRTVPLIENFHPSDRYLTEKKSNHHETEISKLNVHPNEMCFQRIKKINSHNKSSTGERSFYHFHFELYNSHLKNTRRKLKVPVLESLESLREKCRKLGLKLNDHVLHEANGKKCEDIQLEFNDNFLHDEKCKDLESDFSDDISEKAYEVDLIFSHMIIKGETHYFVKWKNFTCDKSTWEPVSNLNGCQEAIGYYHAMENSDSKVDKTLLDYFIRDLTTRKPYDTLTLTKVCALWYDCTENDLKSFKLTVSQIKQKVKAILNLPTSRIEEISKELFHIMQFGEARKRVLINLKEWECEINLKCKSALIKVENNVDLETAPTEFKFISDYINTTINIPEEPVAFCHCKNCYENRESCCPRDSEGRFSYNKHGRLILKPGYPIYECNKFCACDSSCANRVVQHGQKIKVCIFRTANGCGWGLKSLETIDKGEFLCEYLGEIITSDAAEERGKVYDYIARSYLFDLDYGIDSCSYTVDAGHVGNASHFINHSCDPNLHVYAVWVNQPDPNLPRLALFAKRKIQIGEELSFDYQMVQRDRFGSRSPLPESERILCLCNSKNCRNFLF